MPSLLESENESSVGIKPRFFLIGINFALGFVCDRTLRGVETGEEEVIETSVRRIGDDSLVLILLNLSKILGAAIVSKVID